MELVMACFKLQSQLGPRKIREVSISRANLQAKNQTWTLLNIKECYPLKRDIQCET